MLIFEIENINMAWFKTMNTVLLRERGRQEREALLRSSILDRLISLVFLNMQMNCILCILFMVFIVQEISTGWFNSCSSPKMKR